ncbi:MAG: glutathione peroxidase [Bacteroidaceae bacterium]|nr:glutathione peroxidase [Bacteroidaceae bacterium]
MEDIYDFKALTSKGKELDFAQFRGKVLLIVNTASKCGYTKQFGPLEDLNQKYKEQGLTIIGFPCNQFAHQDPGSDSEIEAFCQLNFGVTFQIMKKIDVNGDDAHPIFKYLKSHVTSEEEERIRWNFTKFLISRNGSIIKRYDSKVKPELMISDIEEMLAQK